MLKGIKRLPKSFQFSGQQLYHWCKTVLFSGSEKKQGKHTRYSFEDLRILQDIKRLKEADISTQKKRTCYENVKEWFPGSSDLRLQSFDKRVVFNHNGQFFDAFTEQAYLLNFKVAQSLTNHIVNFNEYVAEKGYESPLDNLLVKVKQGRLFLAAKKTYNIEKVGYL